MGENIRYILNMPRPSPPNNNVTRLVREEYNHWVASNNKAIAYILATMSDVFREKFKIKDMVVKILDSLQEIFEQKNEQACIEITGKYTTTRMKNGTPVRNHVMMMTNYFTEAKLHGAKINQVTQIRIILNSLSPDFIQFNSNYIMNKLNYSVSQLLNELQTFESISRLGKQMVLFIDKPSCSRNRFVKKFTKRKVDSPKRKAIKHNPKIQKPSFIKLRNFRSPMMSKESVSFVINWDIGRRTARST